MKTNHLFNTIIGGSLITSLLFSSCKKDKEETKPAAATYETGVFISNEGPFQNGTGTISFFDRNTKTVTNDLFQLVNKFPLGNIVQSVEAYNGKTYMVVNNAEKIEVVNTKDFQSEGTIKGLSMPRYFLGIDNNKGYVSQWETNGAKSSIAVVDLTTYAIVKTIVVDNGAERMLKSGNNIYVACSGGVGKANTVAVINSLTDELVKTIVVGGSPNSIQQDSNGKLWVLCGGIQDWQNAANNTAGALVRINSNDNSIEKTIIFNSTSEHPYHLTSNAAKTNLYYTYANKVFEQDVNSETLAPSAFINRSFYSIGVDPLNDYIYASDAKDYNSNGWIIRYASSGAAVDSFSVGIVPGNFYFN